MTEPSHWGRRSRAHLCPLHACGHRTLLLTFYGSSLIWLRPRNILWFCNLFHSLTDTLQFAFLWEVGFPLVATSDSPCELSTASFEVTELHWWAESFSGAELSATGDRQSNEFQIKAAEVTDGRFLEVQAMTETVSILEKPYLPLRRNVTRQRSIFTTRLRSPWSNICISSSSKQYRIKMSSSACTLFPCSYWGCALSTVF